MGLSTPVVLGIRIGLEPGRGQAPVRSSVFAVALSVTAITGVLVYTAGAQHLRETPAWRAVPWDDVVFVNELPNGVALAERAAAWPEVGRGRSRPVLHAPARARVRTTWPPG